VTAIWAELQANMPDHDAPENPGAPSDFGGFDMPPPPMMNEDGMFNAPPMFHAGAGASVRNAN
jgi:hypothetical protein